MAGAVEDYSGFMVRGYVNVWFPEKLRPILVHAARELGFGSIAELCRTATREYLEKRGLLAHENKAVKIEPALGGERG